MNNTESAVKSALNPRWRQVRIVLMSNDPIRYILVGLRDDGTMWYKTLTIELKDIEGMVTRTELINYLEPRLINAAEGLNQFADKESPYKDAAPVSDEEFEGRIRGTNGIYIQNIKVDGALRWMLDGTND